MASDKATPVPDPRRGFMWKPSSSGESSATQAQPPQQTNSTVAQRRSTRKRAAENSLTQNDPKRPDLSPSSCSQDAPDWSNWLISPADVQHTISQLDSDRQLDIRSIHTIIKKLAVERDVIFYDPGQPENMFHVASWTPTPISLGQTDERRIVTIFNLPLGKGVSLNPWVVFEFDRSKQQFRIYSSMMDYVKVHITRLHDVGERIGNTLPTKSGILSGKAKWTAVKCTDDLPRMDNDINCGAYAVFFCLCLSVAMEPAQFHNITLWRKIWLSVLKNTITSNNNSNNILTDFDKGHQVNWLERGKKIRSHLAMVSLAEKLHQNALTRRDELQSAMKNEAEFAVALTEKNSELFDKYSIPVSSRTRFSDMVNSFLDQTEMKTSRLEQHARAVAASQSTDLKKRVLAAFIKPSAGYTANDLEQCKKKIQTEHRKSTVEEELSTRRQIEELLAKQRLAKSVREEGYKEAFGEDLPLLDVEGAIQEHRENGA